MEKEKYLAQSQILNRGWTISLIKKHLPEPLLKQNPRYKNASPMKLWPESTVLSVEQSESFQTDLMSANKRKSAAQKGTKTKTNKLKDAMDKFVATLNVKQIDAVQLRKITLREKQDWYNYISAIRDDGYPENNAYDADEQTILRWEVNYIRHNLVSYDSGLAKMFGRVGIREIYPKFKSQILDLISEAYPFLKEECDRQKTPWCIRQSDSGTQPVDSTSI